ncbi:MAG: galactitol-1-phosphate 5-dehydrogenase, partial [Planctomycetales bacterium]|nr:galactitol-1-phosphate 5-dehydrogenase [Planctomycetales bacterium]
MKALVLTDLRKFELQQVPRPRCGPHDVLVEVKACGICGSDVHGYDGSSGRRIPPIVMGHEASGVVAEVGAEVRQFAVGDRVTFDSMISNPTSWFSRRGQANLCDDRRVLGVSCGEYRRDGAFADFVLVPNHIVYRIPDELSFQQAAMVEPVSVAVHAVNRSPLRLSDTVVVVGAGMIGQLCVQAARAGGAGRVIAVDLDDTRLECAAAAGADVTLNSSRTDVIAAVRDQTDGRGADVAFEAVGATEPVRVAIESVRKVGAVVLVGNVTPKIEIPLQSVVTRELSLIGTCGCNGEYPECLSLMARGAVRVDSLISVVAPLEEG